jgi:hypothetical protein
MRGTTVIVPAPHTTETQVVGDLDRRLAEVAEQAKAEAAEARKRAVAREARTPRKPATEDGRP